jgi:methionyl-tRNA formyltransferase
MSLHNRVRGLQPWPGTRGTVNEAGFKILETGLPVAGAGESAGTTIIRNRQLLIQCGDGKRLPILRIQPENRKAMEAAACINGGYIQDGDHWYAS